MSNEVEIEKDLDILALQSKINCDLKKQNIFDGINLDFSEDTVDNRTYYYYFIEPTDSLDSLNNVYLKENVHKEEINLHSYLQYLFLREEYYNNKKIIEDWLRKAQETIRIEIINSINEEKLCLCRPPEQKFSNLFNSFEKENSKYYYVTDIYGITYLIAKYKGYFVMHIMCNIKKNKILSDINAEFEPSIFFIK